MKKILKISKNIVFIFLIIFLLAYLFISAFFPDKTISVFGFSFYRVVTSSMEPEIKTNDVVCVIGAKEEDLEVGDIINFQVHVKINGKVRQITVTHFLGSTSLEDSKRIFLTQSYKHKEEGKFDAWIDQNGDIIQGIAFEDINGKVAFRIPLLGHLITIFKSPVMLILIGTNIFAIVLLIKVIKTKDEPENETAEEEML